MRCLLLTFLCLLFATKDKAEKRNANQIPHEITKEDMITKARTQLGAARTRMDNLNVFEDTNTDTFYLTTTTTQATKTES